MLRALILAGAVALTGVAFAQTPEADPAPPVAQEQATEATEATSEERATGDDAVICRTYRGLGSRLNRQRVCRTRAEWRAETQRNADAVNDNNRRALSTCIPNAGGSCGG